MLRVLITLIIIDLVVIGDGSQIESMMDELSTKMVPIGDPNNLAEEDMSIMKSACENNDKNFLNAQRDKMGEAKGLVDKVLKYLVDHLSGDNIPVCQLLKRGQSEKAGRMVKETNKHVLRAQKVRFGLMTVLHEALKNDTKITLPELICYLNKFIENIIAVHPENVGCRINVQVAIKSLVGGVVKSLEEQKVVPTQTCQLPEATSNPTHFKSFMVPILIAIKHLDKSVAS